MQERLDVGQVGCRTEGMMERRIQERSDAGNKRHRKGGKQERWDSRGYECRKEGTQEMRNATIWFFDFCLWKWHELVCRQFVLSLFCMIRHKQHSISDFF